MRLTVLRFAFGFFGMGTVWHGWQADSIGRDFKLNHYRKPRCFQISVANRDYHYLSQSEIASDKRISQHLSGWTIAIVSAHFALTHEFS
jgi:hypothetical protein